MASDIIERWKVSALASALSSALTHARSESINADRHKLQLLTARKKEWRPATADSSPRRLPVNTVIHTTLVSLEPTTFRLHVGPTRYQ